MTYMAKNTVTCLMSVLWKKHLQLPEAAVKIQ